MPNVGLTWRDRKPSFEVDTTDGWLRPRGQPEVFGLLEDALVTCESRIAALIFSSSQQAASAGASFDI